MIIRLAKYSIQYYQQYSCPTVSSLGVFHHGYSLYMKPDTVEILSMFLHKKSDTLSTATSQSSASPSPSLMESPHTPSPISPHNALLSVCPVVMAVPRYNGSPLIWHTVMQIWGSTRISGDRSFSRSLLFPWLCGDRLARPGIDCSRIIVISHISCSQWCKTHHCLVFIVVGRVSVCVRDILMDSRRQMENPFHATGSDIVCNMLCLLVMPC